LQLLEVLTRQRVSWVDLQCPLELRLGFGYESQLRTSASEVCVGICIVRPETHSGGELILCALKITAGSQCIAQVVVRIEILGSNLLSHPKIGDRVLGPAGNEESCAQRIVDGSILRAKAQGGLVLLNRFLQFALSLQHGPEIVMRLKVLRIVPDIVPRQCLFELQARIASSWIEIVRQYLEPEMRHFIARPVSAPHPLRRMIGIQRVSFRVIVKVVHGDGGPLRQEQGLLITIYCLPNLGGGKFEDVTTKAHIDQTSGHYAFSVSTLDYDNDGWPDIYIACDSTASILYHNNHDGTFSDVAVVAGAAFNEDGREQAGMGSTVGDFNGDGNLDIFRTNFSDDTSTLYRNNGNGTFDDVTFAAGLGLHTQYLGWGTMFFDFDNDGWPDLILANGHVYPEVDREHLGSDYQEPKILYRNNGNSTFTDISADAGRAINQATSARGLAVGDLWNDGRISVLLSNMNAHPSLLVNQVKNGNHWIGFRTIGTKSNRDGIGARIALLAGGRARVEEVRSGSSYSSSSDMRVHFGFGQTSKIEYVEVRWPSGLIEKFQDLAVDSIHDLREGTGTAVPAASVRK